MKWIAALCESLDKYIDVFYTLRYVAKSVTQLILKREAIKEDTSYERLELLQADERKSRLRKDLVED